MQRFYFCIYFFCLPSTTFILCTCACVAASAVCSSVAWGNLVNCHLMLSSWSYGAAFLGGFLDPCNSSFCLALGCHLPRGYQRTCSSPALSEMQAALPAVRWEVTWGCAVLLGVQEPSTKGDVGSSLEEPGYLLGPHQVAVYICYLSLCSLWTELLHLPVAFLLSCFHSSQPFRIRGWSRSAVILGLQQKAQSHSLGTPLSLAISINS